MLLILICKGKPVRLSDRCSIVQPIASWRDCKDSCAGSDLEMKTHAGRNWEHVGIDVTMMTTLEHKIRP